MIAWVKELPSTGKASTGIGFVGATKGKKRQVRKLAGGIIVFGDGELPVKLQARTGSMTALTAKTIAVRATTAVLSRLPVPYDERAIATGRRHGPAIARVGDGCDPDSFQPLASSEIVVASVMSNPAELRWA